MPRLCLEIGTRGKLQQRSFQHLMLEHIVRKLIEVADDRASQMRGLPHHSSEVKSTAQSRAFFSKGLVSALETTPKQSTRSVQQQPSEEMRQVGALIDPCLAQSSSRKARPSVDKNIVEVADWDDHGAPSSSCCRQLSALSGLSNQYSSSSGEISVSMVRRYQPGSNSKSSGGTKKLCPI